MFNGHFSAIAGGAGRATETPSLPAPKLALKATVRARPRSRRNGDRPTGATQTAVDNTPATAPAALDEERQGAASSVELTGPLGPLSIGLVPLLTREEEVELAARIKQGDEEARERMIRANLRLVVKIARDYEHLGLPLSDLVSEGIIGLMKAVDKFDPSKGGKLSTYGSWWIKQQIRRGLANQGRTIRLPVHVEAKLYRLGRAEARLRHLLGREASDDEVAGEMRMPRRRIARLRQAAIRPTSLDAPLGEDESATVSEVVRDESATTPYEALESKTNHAMLRLLLARLPEREARILRYRFGLDGGPEQTLEEVGRKFGLTRERIRQLQNESFKKLKLMMEEPWSTPANL